MSDEIKHIFKKWHNSWVFIKNTFRIFNQVSVLSLYYLNYFVRYGYIDIVISLWHNNKFK